MKKMKDKKKKRMKNRLPRHGLWILGSGEEGHWVYPN